MNTRRWVLVAFSVVMVTAFLFPTCLVGVPDEEPTVALRSIWIGDLPHGGVSVFWFGQLIGLAWMCWVSLWLVDARDRITQAVLGVATAAMLLVFAFPVCADYEMRSSGVYFVPNLTLVREWVWIGDLVSGRDFDHVDPLWLGEILVVAWLSWAALRFVAANASSGARAGSRAESSDAARTDVEDKELT